MLIRPFLEMVTYMKVSFINLALSFETTNFAAGSRKGTKTYEPAVTI